MILTFGQKENLGFGEFLFQRSDNGTGENNIAQGAKANNQDFLYMIHLLQKAVRGGGFTLKGTPNQYVIWGNHFKNKKERIPIKKQ
jgi:hypothetical protein